LGPEPEITDFAGRKTNPNIPFWLADSRSPGLWEGNEKRLVFGVSVFGGLVCE